MYSCYYLKHGNREVFETELQYDQTTIAPGKDYLELCFRFTTGGGFHARIRKEDVAEFLKNAQWLESRE